VIKSFASFVVVVVLFLTNLGCAVQPSRVEKYDQNGKLVERDYYGGYASSPVCSGFGLSFGSSCYPQRVVIVRPQPYCSQQRGRYTGEGLGRNYLVPQDFQNLMIPPSSVYGPPTGGR
jgi:hypothetical protein